ncbi:hypothetical protein [Treponema sp.]|uniref:hypothetical protein n=1 Tax=Treponema sp. TaxID=166 RepID=UPI00388F2F15
MNKEILLTGSVWFFTILFFILACIKKRRLNILLSIFIVIFITVFALITPAGEVLLTFGSFKITLDSLLLGLRRSGVLTGMVFFSRLIINPEMKIGNKNKSKLTKVFYWLNILTSQKLNLKPGTIIDSIDNRLCEIWENENNLIFKEQISQ